MTIIEAVPFLGWVMGMSGLYLYRRRKMRGKDPRDILWSTVGLAFLLLPIAGANVVIRDFGRASLIIWMFSTYALGMVFLVISERYATKDRS